MIPLAKPDINEEDVKMVIDVLKSGRLSMGPYTERFEKAISEYVNAKYGVAVSSGTAGLHLVLKAIGGKEGDYMIVPSFTFIASANVALYEKIIPLFVDIEDETLNVSKDSLEDFLIRIKKGKVKVLDKTVALKDVKYFMGVDIFGHPLDWDEILKTTNEWKLKVLEDSCEALGTEYKGKKVGKFGIAGVFAFYPNKQITTGEGGIIVTNDAKIAELCRAMRNQGRKEMGAWLEHEYLGYNYRMDEMSAALGVSQLKRIDTILKKREKVAKKYTELLKDVDLVSPPIVKPYVKMSWFVYVVKLGEGLDREKIIKKLAEKGIPTRGYFSPIHLQPYIRKILNTKEGSLPVTESIAKRTLALPFHANLSEKDIERVVERLWKCIRY